MLSKIFKNNIPLLSMLLIFTIDLILIFTTHLNWNNAMSKYLPLKSQIQIFKSDISQGHLWFEEAISGDKYIDIEKDVMNKFRHTNFNKYIKNNKNTFSSTEDILYYKQIISIQEKSKAFLSLASMRWENVDRHGIGSTLDQEFDKNFNELVHLIDRLNSEIDKRLALEFENRNKYFIYILVLFFFLNFFVFTVLYITRNKKIQFEKRLFEEKEKAEITLNSIGDAVISADKKGLVQFLNPIAEELTGYSLREAKGKAFEDVFVIFNSLTKKKIESPIKKVLQEGIILELENGTSLHSKKGEVYIIEDSAAPIRNKEGEIVGAVLVFRDVTNDVRIREQLRINEKVLMNQSKQASMGEMIENIAHQWRQPLSAITTAASGMKLEKEFDQLTDEKFNENIDVILSFSNNLSKTLDDFRNFFKPNSEKVLLKIDTLISNALNIVSSKIELHKIKVIVNCESIEIKSFPSEMLQIFVIFFNNSIDAFEKKDLKKFIFIDIKKENDFMIIKFKDSAGGADENFLDRLFEPYFTTKHKSKGKGVSLFMVDEIITKHIGGKLRVSNQTFEYEKDRLKGLEFIIKIKI